MKIGKLGVWCSTNALRPEQLAELAQGEGLPAHAQAARLRMDR